MKNYVLARHVVAVVVILFMFIAFGSPEVHAAAGDFWGDINLASKHTSASEYEHNGRTRDYNEFNYGAGLSYDIDGTFEATGGVFRNSYYKSSYYLGVKVKRDYQFGLLTVTPGVTVGLVTGYDNTEVNAPKYQPMGVPSVSVAYYKVRATFGFIPLRLVTNSETDVVTFQVGWKFN